MADGGIGWAGPVVFGWVVHDHTRVIKLSKRILSARVASTGQHEMKPGVEGPGDLGDLGECRRDSGSPARGAVRLLWGGKGEKRGDIHRIEQPNKQGDTRVLTRINKEICTFVYLFSRT